MLKKIFSITFALVLVLGLTLAMSVPVAAADYDSSLLLENKNSTDWSVITEDGISGTLEYDSTNWEFKFKLTTEGLANGSYSLIYYADYSGDRYGEWGGDNPGAVIGTFNIIDGSGNIASGDQSIDLGMDLPSPPDANIDEHNYCGSPDYYTNCHGAKIWLVPTSALSGGSALPVTAWPPDDNWLFETNLIWYDDFSVGSEGPVALTATVPDITAISVNPSTLDFGTLVPGATSDVLDIIVTNVGTHTVDVDADVSGSAGDLFFDNLKLWTGAWSGRAWPVIVDDLVMGDSKVLETRLPVPSTYTPIGSETATLIFTASAA